MYKSWLSRSKIWLVSCGGFSMKKLIADCGVVGMSVLIMGLPLAT